MHIFKSRKQTQLKSLLYSSETIRLQSAQRWISNIATLRAAHQSILVTSASDKSSKIKLLSHPRSAVQHNKTCHLTPVMSRFSQWCSTQIYTD